MALLTEVRRLYGESAVESGFNTVELAFNDGRIVQRSTRYTTTLAKQNGAWWIVAIHVSTASTL